MAFDESDSLRVARTMIKEQGTKALVAAQLRVRVLEAEGDIETAKLWRQIAAIIERLQNKPEE